MLSIDNYEWINVMKQIFRLVLMLSCLVLSINCHADKAIGVVIGVIGAADIKRGDTQLNARPGTTIFVHDEITSGTDGSRVQLRFNDGTLTTLGESTKFRVNQFHYKSKSSSPNQGQFELLKGVFRTITGLLLKNSGSSYSVSTPVGTIGIRGTDFWGGYLADDNVDVLLISGNHAVEVSNQNGGVFLNTAGEGTTLRKDSSVPVVKVWPEAKVQKAMDTIAWPVGDAPKE
jgi:hypothetical protein